LEAGVPVETVLGILEGMCRPHELPFRGTVRRILASAAYIAERGFMNSLRRGGGRLAEEEFVRVVLDSLSRVTSGNNDR